MTDEPLPINLSIHLIKNAHEDADSFLVRQARLDEHAVQFRQGDGRLFIKRPTTRPPPRARFFSIQIEQRAFGRIASVSAALLLQVKNRWFAITFGPGGRLKGAITASGCLSCCKSINMVQAAKHWLSDNSTAQPPAASAFFS